MFKSTFAEHDRVLLKRQDVLFPLVADANKDQDMNEPIADENDYIKIKDTESSSNLLQLSNSTNNSSSVLVQSQSAMSHKTTNYIKPNGVSSPSKS